MGKHVWIGFSAKEEANKKAKILFFLFFSKTANVMLLKKHFSKAVLGVTKLPNYP